MSEQTNAELIAEANRALAENQWTSGWGVESLAERLTTALEAAEKRADAAERELRVAEDQANTIAGDLAQAERERDNWKLSAEEAERAEKRWKDRAEEAERERDRLDEAFDRDLPWRYDEVETQRNQLAAVVEKVRSVIERESGWFRYRAEQVSTVLASAPADALREHDAALLEGLADEAAVEVEPDAPDDFLRGFDAGADAVYAFLREKARQRRGGRDRG